MTGRSAPELLILHAVRLLGFANSATVAERAGASHDDTLRVLREAERAGWVQHVEFADLGGWSLTDSGKAENERQLAVERGGADPENRIATVYRAFIPLNARLLRAVTDWQIRPTGEDRFAPNDHADATWDGRVLAELDTLNDTLPPLIARLAQVLARFDGYDIRFAAALRRAQGGQRDWVDKTHIDSCHRVWFQLHEDLVATLGIDRGTENTAASW
ncbi:transcriptional regulator [Actinosynnema sp. NPDC023587]|uniref:transcriptional regulator n=1 Tax=Actinosynnema sp. NPDC023587 TaxID=3154695 RepID=UPI0033EE72CE